MSPAADPPDLATAPPRPDPPPPDPPRPDPPRPEPPPLDRRKAADLTIKLGSLDRELRDWTARSAAGGPLEKHHTQIARLATVLGAISAPVKAALDEAVKDGRVLDVARDLERAILEAHRCWDFFRGKLVLRDVALFGPALRAADALAWACYRPAREAAGATAPKEPPLVFLNGGASPFVLPRGERFLAESTLLDEDIESPEVDALLRELPIPVVGIPWFHADHAPDMLVIGHEIGHAVEGDLALGPRLAELLDASGIPDDRRRAWRSWLGEVFADVYGALALGPAFARCLADFLATAPSDVVSEARVAPQWGVYPTAALRVRLVTATLTGDFPEEATAAWAAWKSRYPTHAMDAFEPDAATIATAIADGAYPALGGQTLRSCVAFSAALQEEARLTAALLLGRRKPVATDARVLFAGARIAFETSPATYAERGVTAAIFAHVTQVEERGVREKSKSPPPIPTAADVALGARLFEALRSTAKRPVHPPAPA